MGKKRKRPNLWEEATRFIEKLEREFPECDFELFDVAWWNGVVVKIGIYPAGVFFLEDEDFRGIKRQVKEIIYEMYKKCSSCPYCGRKLSFFEISYNRNCSCEATFRRVYSRCLTDDYLQTDVEKEIAEALGGEEKLIAYLSMGFKLEDVVEGVRRFYALGEEIFAFKGELILKPEDEIFLRNSESMMKHFLLKNGFVCEIVSSDGTLWIGKIDGEERKAILTGSELFVVCDFTVDISELEERTGEDFFDYFYEEIPDSSFPFCVDEKYNHTEWYEGVSFSHEEVLKAGLLKIFQQADELFRKAEEKAVERMLKK